MKVLGFGLIRWIEAKRSDAVCPRRCCCGSRSPAATKLIAARLGDGADDAAGRGAKFRVVARRLDLNLLDKIRRGVPDPTPCSDTGRVHAVDDVSMLGAARAVDLNSGLRFDLRPGEPTLMRSVKSPTLGMRSMTSALIVAVAAFCFTSMIGDWAVTWTVSIRPRHGERPGRF